MAGSASEIPKIEESLLVTSSAVMVNDALRDNALDRHEADWTSYKMANSDFWLLLHRLADAVGDEGKDRGARQAAISASFRSLPATAQRELVHDFRLVLGELSALEATMREATLCRSEEAMRQGSER